MVVVGVEICRILGEEKPGTCSIHFSSQVQIQSGELQRFRTCCDVIFQVHVNQAESVLCDAILRLNFWGTRLDFAVPSYLRFCVNQRSLAAGK